MGAADLMGPDCTCCDRETPPCTGAVRVAYRDYSCSPREQRPATATATIGDFTRTITFPAAGGAAIVGIAIPDDGEAHAVVVTITRGDGTTESRVVNVRCGTPTPTVQFDAASYWMDYRVFSYCVRRDLFEATVTFETPDGTFSCTSVGGEYCRINIAGNPYGPGPSTVTVTADGHEPDVFTVPGRTVACRWQSVLQLDADHTCCFQHAVSACWLVTTPIGSFIGRSDHGTLVGTLYGAGPAKTWVNGFPECTNPPGEDLGDTTGAPYRVLASCNNAGLYALDGQAYWPPRTFLPYGGIEPLDCKGRLWPWVSGECGGYAGPPEGCLGIAAGTESFPGGFPPFSGPNIVDVPDHASEIDGEYSVTPIPCSEVDGLMLARAPSSVVRMAGLVAGSPVTLFDGRGNMLGHAEADESGSVGFGPLPIEPGTAMLAVVGEGDPVEVEALAEITPEDE